MNLVKQIDQEIKSQYQSATIFLRKKNFIEYEVAGGRRVAVFCRGLHYGNQEDQEIDTAWVSDTAPWSWKMESADYKIQAVSNFNSGQILRFSVAGENVTFQPQQLQWTNDQNQIQATGNVSSVTGSVVDNSLIWNNAFGSGRTFQYLSAPEKLEKRLIISSYSNLLAPSQTILNGGNPVLRLQFIFQISNNINIYVNNVLWDRQTRSVSQGLVEFRHSTTNQILWRFQPGFAYDNNGDSISPSIVLRRQGNNLFVEVRTPQSWLAAAAYPVVIDPTTDLQPDETSGTDTWITEANGTNNNGIATTLISGDTGTAGVNRRLLLKFDLSSIPSGSTINSATLYMTCTGQNTGFDRSVGIHRGKVLFYEGNQNGATPAGGEDASVWNFRNYNGSVAWAGGAGGASGTEFEAVATDTVSITEINTEFSWTVDSDLTYWVTNGNTNFGWWGINVSEGTLNSGKTFASSSHATSSYRPKLTVDYTLSASGNFMTTNRGYW